MEAEAQAAGETTSNDSGGTPEQDLQASALDRAVARYREVLAAMPGLIPDMVVGATIEEVDASAERGRQAYEAISRRIVQAHESQVPPGNPPRSAGEAGIAMLKPEAKIALGLRGR